ncbi:MAG: recombinase family protein [Robiginitomaculum sp.]|nr:recombinase family protein [Robiginitomaculum sp.]
MKLAIALLRVSTDKQFHHGDSIDTQKTRVDHAAERDGASIISYFTEHYSGRKTNRVVIEDMLAFLDEHTGEIQVVYIVQIDRFTRAGSEMYLYLKRQLHKRGVDLRDAMGIIQKSINTLEHVGFEYDWSITSPSQTAEVMQAEYANQEVNQILTRTIGQQIKLAQEGYQTRSAEMGFRNVKITRQNGRKATIMEPLEPEASWIRALFELRAAGALSDEAICDKINAMGYKSRIMHRRDKSTGEVIAITGNKPLSPKQLQRLVAKPIYCGVRVGKWTHNQPIKAPFDGLVSMSLFNRANHGAVVLSGSKGGDLSIEHGQSRKHATHLNNPDFLLRHVVMCPKCAKPFWASKSRGKSGQYFGYFHCARAHKSVSISQSEFQKTIGCYLDKLEAKPGFLGLFKEVVRETWIAKNKSRQEEFEAIDKHIKTLELRQQNILDRITVSGSTLVQKKLEQEIEDLEGAIKSAKKERSEADLGEEQIEQFFQRAKNRLEHPKDYGLAASTKGETVKTWQTIFAHPPTFDELKSGTPQLTLLYRLNRHIGCDKKQLAAHLSVNWNTFVREVEHQIE